MDIDQDSAGVKFMPPAAFAGTLVVGLALGRFLGSPGLPLSNSTERGIGWLAAILGIGIVFSAIGLFRAAGTDTQPWKRTTTLVTDGVYRWSRNPMYFGMALAYAGVAIWLDSLVALLLLIPVVFVIQKEVVEREENYLAGKFGERYLAYKGAVRRWI
ncbi:isoprenylcysteine carboxylmethyltransferase family protein [Sphingomonas sp. HITSZ_GF]|uniref:methyltransferase family protein n=1 Tax=Sphingomonas sp. HITSZ_GF TaxID=3037247 RepID=UPI00240E197A|nr:isoprenylcysteine carboxylmethyltransferase family protein [Sphingomonas sp. HITSZ_GF]MDG2535509.1 isoprenylcysteine carboxylmethyltransferase family protein [Sphingomonas sp. HITSZ_GF]